MRHLQSALLATVAAIGFASIASAADMPVKAPMMVPVAYNWTGFYIGGNVGGAWSGTDVTTTNAPGVPGIFGVPANIALVNALGTGSANSGGKFTGGVQIGYNWQVSPQWLVGVEADINSLNQTSALSGTGVSTIGPIAVTNSVSTNWLATFRGRLGLTFDRSLIYVTGGAAVTDMSYTQTFNGILVGPATAFGTSTVNSTKAGWTVGAGWEQALWDKWSVKAEYLFARFGGLSTNTLVTLTGAPNTQNLTGSVGHLDVQIARVGLNYRF
jgi:outer membrane immunogenic protein